MNPLLCFAILVPLIMIDAIQMAYYTAVCGISEKDLIPDEEGNAQITEPALSRVKQARNNASKLFRSVVFWQIQAAAQGAVALWMVLPHNRFLVAFLLTAIVYLLGVSLPNLIARLYKVKTAALLSAPSRVFTVISLPFTAPISWLSALPVRLAGIDPKRLDDEVTEDEILSMVNEGHEQGAIDTDEAQMISNIFELDDKHADDIMTHRGDILSLEASMTLDEAIRFMVQAPNSRFPVYEENIDNITGSLYLKDAMLFHLKDQYHDQSIGQIPHLLREVQFIPETTNVDDLLWQMQESRKQMAIVVNEYGETSGLVTMEDILEEIVGNILDEYDSEEKLIARSRDGHLRMNGKALLDDVWKTLGTSVDQDDYVTLSGYLTPKLGHIPTDEDRGTVIEDKVLGWRFRILSINGTMIGWTDVSRLPAEEKEKEKPALQEKEKDPTRIAAHFGSK